MPGPTTKNVVNNAPIVAGTAHQISSTYSGITATVALTANVVNSSQTLFTAYLNATQANVSGDGTVYTIPYNATLINQGGHYSTGTATFTAPVTGNYLFSTSNIVFGAATNASAQLNLVTTTASYVLCFYQALAGTLNIPVNGFCIAPMNAGNTALIQLTMAGSSRTAQINGSGSPYDTFFTGVLLPA